MTDPRLPNPPDTKILVLAVLAQCVYRHLLCMSCVLRLEMRMHLKRVMRAARDAYLPHLLPDLRIHLRIPLKFRTIRATSYVANHRKNCGVPRTRRLCTLVPGVMIGCPLSGSQRLSFYESQLG
ncbi:hypothetical protein BDZ89DRAFT_1076241, partial [Hymenopellis radicata]